MKKVQSLNNYLPIFTQSLLFMRNALVLGLTFLLVILIQSCRKDFDFELSQGNLEFSKDTVYLDTVFTNIGTSTYTLKVYNKSNANIKIPSIRLADGEASNYRLMVDGMSGKVFQNVELLAKDSMYVFIEATIDYEKFKNPEASFLYTDKLIFQSLNITQNIEIVTLVRDAHFLYPKKNSEGILETLPVGEEQINGFYLSENDPIFGNSLHWTADKPYVIYGYAGVPQNKELLIEAGAEIYFHRDSGVIVAENAKIRAIGTIEKPIHLQGNRLEYSYRYTPGQWGTIWLTPDSNGTFENVKIQNPTIGLFVNKNKGVLNLHNVQIYNASQYGILTRTAQIEGDNVVIGSAGSASLACTLGGTYSFIHSTFINLWNTPNHTAVWIDNGDGKEEFRLHKALFANSILYSQSGESLILTPASEKSIDFPLDFDTNFIKFYDENNRLSGQYPYTFDDNNLFKNNFIQRRNSTFKPLFLNTSKNQFQLTSETVEILGTANRLYSQQFPSDITGRERINEPDLGAYQHIIQEKE